MMFVPITVEEASENFDFIVDLVQRGTTFKIVCEGKKSVLLTGIDTPDLPDFTPSIPEVPVIPEIDSEQIHSYVHETLAEMQQDL